MPVMVIVGHRPKTTVVDYNWGHHGDIFIQNHELPDHAAVAPTPRMCGWYCYHRPLPVLKPERFHFTVYVPSELAPNVLHEPALF